MSYSNVVLIGPPGSGKTSVGQLLADLTNRRFFDTDRVIEEQQGTSVTEIFKARGESYFRSLESDLLDQMSTEKWSDVVLGTGGGIVVTDGNLEKLERLGLVVCLFAPASCLLARLKTDETRPLLASGDDGSKEKRIQDLLTAREAKYRRARHVIETSNLSPVEVAGEIEKLLGISDGITHKA